MARVHNIQCDAIDRAKDLIAIIDDSLELSWDDPCRPPKTTGSDPHGTAMRRSTASPYGRIAVRAVKS